MNLRIDQVNAYSTINRYSKPKRSNQNIQFKGNVVKTTRNIGLGMAMLGLLAFSSCLQKKENANVDEEEMTMDNKNTNNIESGSEKISGNNEKSIKSYYYVPFDGELNADNYSWSETVYKDGRIERDSLGYKIYISPKGERTEVKTEQDKFGVITTTTKLPDGTKIVRTNYVPTKESEIIYTEKTYRPDSTLSKIFYYNKYPTDSTKLHSDVKTDTADYYYNEKEILIKWHTNMVDPERNDSLNKYDKKNRLIYNDITNETYKYKKDSMNPYESVAVLDGCKRITLYNEDGSVQKVYFKAEDNTITE